MVSIPALDRRTGLLSVLSVAQFANGKGYVIYGSPEDVYTREKMIADIKQLEQDGEVTFLSFQTIKCPTAGDVVKLYNLAVMRRL